MGLLPSFIIRIEDRHNPAYWLTVLARQNTLLSDLECLIKDVWVKGGDHLSAFVVGNETYLNTDTEMAVPLADLIKTGSLFYYEYDFESTTELKLKVLGVTPVMPPEEQVCLIARNLRPSFTCSLCGEKADFSVTYSGEESPRGYFCMHCIKPVEDGYIRHIDNSPRNGAWDYQEDTNAAIKWYPPGWNVDELLSPDIQQFMTYIREYQEKDQVPQDDQPLDDEIVVDMINAVSTDIGDEIKAFIEEERTAYGDEAAILAEEIVMTCSTMVYGYYEKKIEDWDAPLIRTTLLKDTAQNPALPDEWLEETVPVLCRFLTFIEKVGRHQDTAAMITELQETEPLFQEIVRKQRDALNGQDSDNPDAMPMAECDTTAEDIFMAGMDDFKGGSMRVLMTNNRCEEFCAQIDDERVPQRCREILSVLITHPDAPLSRGGGVLWSAAIVYMACQNEGLIGRGKSGSTLPQEIAGFFDLELSSIRNKVTALKKRLAECGPKEQD
ncbi:hypothetical protein JCM10550A_16890 [Methanogenium cariaci]